MSENEVTCENLGDLLVWQFAAAHRLRDEIYKLGSYYLEKSNYTPSVEIIDDLDQAITELTDLNVDNIAEVIERYRQNPLLGDLIVNRHVYYKAGQLLVSRSSYLLNLELNPDFSNTISTWPVDQNVSLDVLSGNLAGQTLNGHLVDVDFLRNLGGVSILDQFQTVTTLPILTESLSSAIRVCYVLT